MAAPHQDKDFNHSVHIIAMVLSLGVWMPVWLTRWSMHKVDRTREAVYEIEQRLDAMAARQARD